MCSSDLYHSAERKGYSSVATWCKTEPLSVETAILDDAFNREGRIVLTEHDKFFLYNVYFPNGQKDQDRLDYKLRFYGALQEHIRERDKIKPVIIVGDFNTAHTDIDLARPKPNEKTSGFLPEERVGSIVIWILVSWILFVRSILEPKAIIPGGASVPMPV